MILGFALRAILAVAAVAAVAAIVINISGMITKATLQENLKGKNMSAVIVKKINRCTNQISLEDLNSDQTVEVHGDGVSYELYEGDVIYI